MSGRVKRTPNSGGFEGAVGRTPWAVEGGPLTLALCNKGTL